MYKKIIWIFIFLFFFCLISCKNDNNEKKLVINYYDGDTLIESKEYINEVDIFKYFKKDYSFIGWYLDKEFNLEFKEEDIEKYFEKENINLYAKMEINMNRLNITIKGLIDNEVVLNPLFTWNNTNDTKYKLTLLLDGEAVEEKEATETSYQFNKLLNKDTNYVLEVVGLDSGTSGEVSFKTLTNYNNSITSIKLVNPYMDGMVMQRDVVNTIAGVGPMNQLIILSIDGDNYYDVADNNGFFEIELPAHNASFEPTTIKISNGLTNIKLLSDVLFGDVYLFAGQSNMQWSTKDSDYESSDLENLTNLPLRFFCQDITTSTTKLDSVKNGRWFKPNQYNVGGFSAISTITGSLLATSQKEVTPIGIITAYQGDTNIANWMGSEYYKGNVSTKHLHYNAMVYPLHYASIKGVVWYQGCNNSASGPEYKQLLLDFFQNYRDLFNNPNLPFFVIGLACYDGDSGNNFDFSYVRESQALACAADNNAYFISTCDDGDPTYIHPRAKRYICVRLAKSMGATYYGMDYLKEGPSYKSHSVNGNVVTIDLYNYEGLRATGEIKGLFLASEDGKYYEAIASIQNEKIVAYSDKVDNPVYIKYGFGKSPFVNIFNKDGYAIVPFRTDNLNTNIDLFDYNNVDKYYFHPDGSKMEISINDGNLLITKTNDGKTYGSIRLDKWGAIIYQPQGFRFTIKGTNSGARITIRFIEGDSYEIWGYGINDDFVGEKTFNIGIGDLSVIYNKQNNIFEPQKIGYVEIMVEDNNEASFELCEARFVSIDRTKPLNFTIANVIEQDNKVNVTLAEALFANQYQVSVIEDGNEIYLQTSDKLSFDIDINLFSTGKPYYINATAINEIGRTDALNSGYVFYLKDEETLIICNFDFKDQDSFDAYMASSMSVHTGLNCLLQDKGVKIESSGAGWQQFIFKLDSSSANGMNKLKFYADFSNYNGTVVMQLCNPSFSTYDYNLDLSTKKEGIFEIDFSEFKNSGKSFTGQTLLWVMFNFNDSIGNGYIILDDVILTK